MSKADLLEQWGDYLARSRRRSPHTVRAYLAAANRLMDRRRAEDWGDVATIDAAALRDQLAARRAEGIGKREEAQVFAALGLR